MSWVTSISRPSIRNTIKKIKMAITAAVDEGSSLLKKQPNINT